MKTEEIKQKLHRYIETANEKKLKAIYTMVEEEIEETSDLWNDEEFVAELERREKEYLKGTAKTYSLKEAEARARQAIKKVKAG
ncbi:MAG TPA: hypothetical protein VH396_03175 [Chitinophagaceae bacterium]|jgi:dsRNA-specific ribonuclease